MAVTSSPPDSNGKEVVEKSQAKCPGVRVVGGRIYDSQNGKTCHQVMSDSFDRILMISGPFFFCFFSPSSLVDENMQENERNLNFKFQFFFYPWVD
jgi:hypothetical protein